MAIKSYKKMVSKAQKDVGYWVEDAKLDFSVELHRLLDRKVVNNTELAKRLGTSKAYITKLFRGDANVTIETMVKAACACGGRLHIHIADETASKVKWFELFKTPQPAIPEPVSNYWKKNSEHTTFLSTESVDEELLSNQA